MRDNACYSSSSVYDMRFSFCRRLAVFLWVLVSLPALAQLPSLLPAKPAKTPVSNSVNDAASTNPDKLLADAQKRLKDAQEAAARLQSQLDQKGLSDEARLEQLKQFNLRQTLADRYAQQIDYLKQLQPLDEKIADAKRAIETWSPPAGSPPWSVLDGDAVRYAMLSQENLVNQLTRKIDSLATQILTLAREQAESEVRMRQLQEKLGDDPAKLGDADRQQLDLAKAQLALKGAILLRTDLERQVREKEKTLEQLRYDLSAKTWNYYGGRFILSAADLAKHKADIQSYMDSDRAKELKALADLETAQARLAKAQRDFAALDQNKASPQQRASAQAALDIAQVREAAAQSVVERLRQLIEMGGYGIQAWDVRAELYATPKPDASRVNEIAQRIQVGLLRVRQARDLVQQTLSAKEQEAFDLRDGFPMHRTLEQKQVLEARLESVNVQSDSARVILGALDKFEQFLTIIKLELGIKDQQQSWLERVTGYGQIVVGWTRSVWNYELFTVDDTVIADGKEVRASRSVTIGKSIGAIAILLFGFLMVSWLIRSSVSLAERRIGLKSSSATLIRRWLTVVATATLIVLSFNLVQIPLSVFAFLGGALAIGVGFGTQNLLKNLISGIMLLVERPIRIGDLVAIDGLKGRVTSIGIRFSTIHSSDGVDTLIPNSELVEKKLVNWTYSNPDARREIRLGVAYGSDVVQVKNLLQAAALEHQEVERSPAPNVTLDDFGDNALIFTLRFWIRLDQGIDGARIDSDLRCEILEKFAAVGIELPYPQRDIHVRTSEPVPVRITQDQG